MKKHLTLPKIKQEVRLDCSPILREIIETIGIKRALKIMFSHAYLEHSHNLVMPFDSSKFAEENTEAFIILMHIIKKWKEILPEAMKTFNEAYNKACIEVKK
jgi:hypothetical protein